MRELRKKEKGVSEVIGTILILAITVVLFSSIFYYVAVMPPPKSQVYSSFVSSYQINSNGTFNITVTNNGGESLPVDFTELLVAVQNPSGQAHHFLSYSNIYNQIKNSYFKVGSSFTYYSYWDKLSATYLSTIAIYLIDTQNNQVVYSNTLQGAISNVYIMGFSYNPDPFPANATFVGHITSFVIYNQNSKILPKVTISMPVFNIKNQSMSYVSPMQFSYSQSLSAVKSGTYKIFINATLGKSVYNYTGFIQVANTALSAIALRITSISLQNPEPVHGSNTTIFISIYNPSNRTEKFRLNITDHFSSYPNNWSYIYTTPTSYNDPTSNFTIGPMTTVPITVPWYKIGGSYVAAGIHQLNVTFLNVTPYIATAGNSINVTVYPKIIFVGDGFSTSSSSNVYNDYYWLFKYLNFPITITAPTPSPSIFVNISGYDFVIWVMGSSGASLGPNQNELSNLLNQGGSLLLIGNGSSAFNNLVYDVSATSSNPPINKNTTIKYQNLTKISPNSFNEIINYTANVTAPLQYVTFSGAKPLANFSKNSNPAAIYGVVNNSANHGKYVFIGYQFSSMFLYQQYYVMNKIVMWLSNISILSGVQDIALIDMKVSNQNPMFMSPVNFTFYIQNFSPGVFGPTYLEFEINGQTVPVIQNNATIPSNNIYVPPIPGNGAIIPLTITWYADITPGTYQIFAYVNPYHDPPEINYNNNILSSMINVNLNVKFSILLVYAHTINEKYNISGVLKALNNTVGSDSYKFINYTESKGAKSTSQNLSRTFQNYNLVIIDVNNTGSFDSNLTYAIKTYVNNPNSYKYPYSLLILGENAGNSLKANSKLMNILNISSITTFSNPNSLCYLNGLVYKNVNINIGPFGQNLSRGYGILYNYKEYSTVITLYNKVNGTAIFDVYNYSAFSQANRTGNAVIENLSNVIVTIFPYDFENIVGFVQNHTLQFSPVETTSNPLIQSSPNSVQYAKNFLMMNFLVASRYLFNKPLPEILAPDINLNSKVVTLNNYYLFTVTMRNLGASPIYVTLEAFEETSMFYSSQPIYLVGSTMNSITTVTATVIWKPTYASSPNPEWLRFVLVPSSGQIPLSPMQEALITQKVYFFYDNLTNGGTNWNHYATVFGYEGTLYNDQTSGINDNGWYSSEPYSEFGSVTPRDLQSSINSLTLFQTYIYDASGVYDSSNQNSWNFYENGLSGGYSIGISWDINSYSGSWSQYDYVLETNAININNAASAYLEFYANYQLAFGAEGVVVFISHDEGNWYYIQPMQGYPANVEFITPSGYGTFYYPINGGLTPAFNTLSGGWTFYKFDLCHTWYGINASQWNKLYIMFVFSYASDREANTYGNDGFYIDDIKVIETGPLTQQPSTINGDSIGDTWSLSEYNGQQVFSNSLSYYEIDNLVSIPISLTNAIYANFNFQTNYTIWSRWSLANIIEDVPNGFRVYIGVMSTNGGIKWHQLDTRWAGESGITPPGLNWASNIPSNFYTGIGAFSPNTGSQINITQFAGQTIYIKFEVNGDYPTEYYYNTGFEGTYGLITSTNSNYVILTNVIVQGYSLYSPIQVQTVWT